VTGYRSVVDANLVPHFGEMLLGQIKPSHIEKDFKAKLLKSGLSARTVRNKMIVLQRMLGSAVQWEYI